MLRPYLELVRVFLTPSAVADSFVGLVLTTSLTGVPLSQSKVLLTAGASVGLYWFGMVTNDLFDLQRDTTRAPAKPLPSGRISTRAASALAVLLAGSSLALAYAAGALLAASLVLVFALLYNAGGKRVPVAGDLLMGACRSANLLLGATAVCGTDAVLSHSEPLIASGLIGLYTAGVTCVSRLEDRTGGVTVFLSRTLPLFLLPAALVALRWDSPANWVNAAMLAGLLATFVKTGLDLGGTGASALRFVRGALGGIFLVDAGILWALAPESSALFRSALILYGLFFLGWWWKRRWLQSGGQDT